MRMDIADMRLVVSIADAGSITQGARLACLALASASERLKSIEEDAGVRLLERHPRGVILTDAGLVFVTHARQILAQHERLNADLSAFANGSRGKIRLYANTSAMTEFLPRRLAPWLSEHPDVVIELEERSSTDIVNIICNGTGEAGFVSDAVNGRGLTLEPVADDRLVLIVPTRHALGNSNDISLSDVLHEPFVGLHPGNALQDHISGHAAQLGHSLTYRIRMNSPEGVCDMVSNGIGVGILPDVVADRFQQKYPCRKLYLTDAWARRKICICFKSRASLSPAMRKLLDFLKKSPL